VVSFAISASALARGADRLALSVNSLLPPDVRLLSLAQAPRHFSARFCAVGKEYTYRVDNGAAADPLTRRTACHVFTPLDLEALRAAAAALEGEHDFSAFANTSSQPRCPLRLLSSVRAEGRAGGALQLRFTGSGFLYRQVRNMAGCLLRVGSGRMQLAEVRDCLASGRRPAAVKAVPAHGLCLTRVYYGEEKDCPPELLAWRRLRDAEWERARAAGLAPQRGEEEEEEEERDADAMRE
jgi:tRNA pseudouridine38-40 synthase